ncbi:hypothetical protein FDF74_08355 [Clostridium niameyense]|uniref:Uncharacterized protein n=1 Tax=Clostridium niameyense TaxID=1622073 RepID=A0A6M0RC85_9CLOT|nr:hypothetical protein [Clostridium niameyense]NEZ47219.1 hypothetical protein [Clostridium niameyense]
MEKFIKKGVPVLILMGMLVCSIGFGSKVQAAGSAKPVSYFKIMQGMDGEAILIYDRNDPSANIQTIKQEKFPLYLLTYQIHHGSITEVSIDNKKIPEVRSEDEFYRRGENEPVFYEIEKKAAEKSSYDNSVLSWETAIAISTLSKGEHTITLKCQSKFDKLQGNNTIYDSIKINVQ